MATVGDRTSCAAGVVLGAPPPTPGKIKLHTPAKAVAKPVVDRCMAIPVQDLGVAV